MITIAYVVFCLACHARWAGSSFWSLSCWLLRLATATAVARAATCHCRQRRRRPLYAGLDSRYGASVVSPTFRRLVLPAGLLSKPRSSLGVVRDCRDIISFVDEFAGLARFALIGYPSFRRRWYADVRLSANRALARRSRDDAVRAGESNECKGCGERERERAREKDWRRRASGVSRSDDVHRFASRFHGCVRNATEKASGPSRWRTCVRTCSSAVSRKVRGSVSGNRERSPEVVKSTTPAPPGFSSFASPSSEKSFPRAIRVSTGATWR